MTAITAPLGTTVRPAAPATLPDLLRHWRRQRGLSQLELALRAGVSQRHLSFVESSRASPSRELVMVLARELDVPLRQRNQMLMAAGFAPVFTEHALDAPPMQAVRQAIELILARQEPYPAVVVDRLWNLQNMNAAFLRLAQRLLGGMPAPPPGQPLNLIEATFDPQLLRPWIANWDEVAGHMLHRMHQVLGGPTADAAARRLLERVGHLAGELPHPATPTTAAPFLPVVLERDGFRASFFTTLTTLGSPLDVTTQELMIECYFPADEATHAAMQELAAG